MLETTVLPLHTPVPHAVFSELLIHHHMRRHQGQNQQLADCVWKWLSKERTGSQYGLFTIYEPTPHQGSEIRHTYRLSLPKNSRLVTCY